MQITLCCNFNFKTAGECNTALKIEGRSNTQKQSPEVFLKISQISQENICVEVSFLQPEAVFNKFHRKTPVLESLYNKVADLQVCNFFKKRLQHRSFPVQICKTFKNTYFEEHLRATASKYCPPCMTQQFFKTFYMIIQLFFFSSFICLGRSFNRYHD